MKPADLIRELQKLPANAEIRYLDLDLEPFAGDVEPDGSIDWIKQERRAAVGIDWPEQSGT